LPIERVRAFVLELVDQIDQLTPDEFKGFLKCAVPEYQPQPGPLGSNQPRPEEARMEGEAKDNRNGSRSSSEPGLEESFHRVEALDAPG